MCDGREAREITFSPIADTFMVAAGNVQGECICGDFMACARAGRSEHLT